MPIIWQSFSLRAQFLTWDPRAPLGQNLCKQFPDSLPLPQEAVHFPGSNKMGYTIGSPHTAFPRRLNIILLKGRVGAFVADKLVSGPSLAE